MKPAVVLAIAALCVGAVGVGGYFLLPGTDEEAAMSLRDKALPRARGLYDRLLSEGRRSIETLVPRAELAVRDGDPQTAIALLVEARQLAPGDTRLRDRLATLYRQTGDFEAYLDLAAAPTRKTGDTDALRALAGLERLVGDNEAVVQTLAAITARKDAEWYEVEDLAARLAANAQSSEEFAQAAAVMRARMDLWAEDSDRLDGLLRYATYLSLAGRSDLLAEDLPNLLTYLTPAERSEVLSFLARSISRDLALSLGWQPPTDKPATTTDGASPGEGPAEETRPPQPSAEDRLYGLIEAKRWREALPLLRARVQGGTGEWDWAYEQALRATDNRDELVRHLRGKAVRKDLPKDDRRALAFALLDLGDKSGAAAIFQALAATAGPDHPDLAQLLFLWGPRPGDEALAWLAARAETVLEGPQERFLAWIDLLLGRGGEERARALLTRRFEMRQETATGLRLVDILRQDGDARALETILLVLSKRDLSDAQTLRLAQTAQAAGLESVALGLYERAGTRPAHLEAAKILLYRGAYTEAAERFARLNAKNDPSAESLFLEGEAQAGLGNRRRARTLYRQAESRLPADITGADFTDRRIAAMVLARLGRMDEAAALFDRLLAERPTDLHLRADYADALLAAGREDAAARVLGSAP